MSSVFLGLDISMNRTGWGLYEALGAGRKPFLSCGSWDCRGEDFLENVALLGDRIHRLYLRVQERQLSLTAAAIEHPLRVLPKRKVTRRGDMFAGEDQTEAAGNPLIMNKQWAMAGAAAVVLKLLDVPVRTVESQVWRMSFLGVGRAPKELPIAKRTPWLKKQAKEKADQLGRSHEFVCPNHDAAEGLGIAFWLRAQFAMTAAA